MIELFPTDLSADQLADLIQQISADAGSVKVENRLAHIELIRALFTAPAAIGGDPIALSFNSTAFNLAAGVEYTLTIPPAVEIVSPTLYDSSGFDITSGLSVQVIGNQVKIESNVALNNVTAKVVFNV